MLQGAVLPLRLLTDNNQVQVVVARVVAWQAVYMHNVGEQVQFTPGSGQRGELPEQIKPTKNSQTALA